MARLWIICTLRLLMAAAPAMDAETKKDVRCFTALAVLASSPDEMGAAAIVAQYYLGRIDARMPRLDLEEAIASEADSMTAAEVNSLIISCSKTVAARGNDLMVIGKNLEKRGAVTSSPTS